MLPSAGSQSALETQLALPGRTLTTSVVSTSVPASRQITDYLCLSCQFVLNIVACIACCLHLSQSLHTHTHTATSSVLIRPWSENQQLSTSSAVTATSHQDHHTTMQHPIYGSCQLVTSVLVPLPTVHAAMVGGGGGGKGKTKSRVAGSACAGALELAIFHPVDTIAKRLMSTKVSTTDRNRHRTTVQALCLTCSSLIC